MSTTAPSPRRTALHEAARAGAIPPAAALCALSAGWLIVEPTSGARLLLAAGLCLALGSLALMSPRQGLFALLVWLAALGFLRRLISLTSEVSGADPLLLVAPVIVAVLVWRSLEQGAGRGRGVLGTSVLAFTALIVLGALNPLQGGIGTGIAGLLFTLVPVLGFFIGRGLVDDRGMATALGIVAVLAVPSAIYGLIQTHDGFPAWDARWITDSGYAALNVGGTIRPFANFSAAAEYAFYIAIAMVVISGFLLRRGRFVVGLPLLAILGAALVFGASRTPVVLYVLAGALMLAAVLRLALGWALVLGATALLLIPIVAGAFVPSGQSASGASALTSHQLGGLADPTNEKSSTLAFHLTMVGDGLSTAVRQPLGLGTGAVSAAASKFGGVEVNTEADPSNAAVAFGLPGFVAYLLIFIVGMRRAYVIARRRRDPLALVVLGLLVVTLFHWLDGGEYAVAILPWLALGWVDRTWQREGDSQRSTPSPETG